MNNNNLEPVSISSLLDGRVFLIPSYQRGYRWERKQITDLLSDLLKFALKKTKQDGEFYCLQPVIVQPITDLNQCQSLLSDCDSNITEAWEVVDGQQRLTSILILLRCLMGFCKIDDNEFADDYGKRLYHIVYETRIDDIGFLEKLNNDSISEANNIDTSHMADAYQEITNWLRNDGKILSSKLNGPDAPKLIAEKLLNLLVSPWNKNNKEGSVQVIWYEIFPDEKKNPIDEFLKINNGKIRLTDAELIKALFLQKRNFTLSEQEIKQIEISMQWEQIENTLHRSDFWSCFSQDDIQEDNRITLLLNLVYQNEHNGELPKEESDLFRFYNEKFEVEDNQLQTVIKDTWYTIIKWFRLMEDWYEDPVLYNYIGLLSRYDVSLYAITKKYEQLSVESTQDDFISALKEMVAETLQKINYSDDYIDLKYGNRYVQKLLLFLNVNQLIKQIVAIRHTNEDYPENDDELYMSPIYKFPFDLFDAQDWDVEHIDSATTNALKTDENKIKWITQARIELANDINENQNEELEQLILEKKYMDAISMLRQLAEEEDDNKDWIGNLTLLDYQTNRSYGNSLFSEKRRIIQERINNVGVFVPICTQYVFNKTFGDIDSKSNLKWTKADKEQYHHFILSELKDFLNSK